MIYLLFFPIAMIALISGCTATSFTSLAQKQRLSQEQLQKKSIIKKEATSSLPDWILDSNKDGYICGIGSSQLHAKMSMTKKIALIAAKAKISEQIKTFVDAQQKVEAKCINEECNNKYSSITNLSSSNMITNSRITDKYLDDANNIYYVRVCSKITKKEN